MEAQERQAIVFPDYPAFTPNVTPREMFQMRVFGGSYWRTIDSAVTGQRYQNVYINYPCLVGLDRNLLAQERPDNKSNRYEVAAGASLQEWEASGWIAAQDPYGWVEWYCRFYGGRRSPDDARQIDRWQKFAGPHSGRFRTNLINKIKKTGGNIHDYSISPVIRQGLLQWGYELTISDYRAK